MSVRVRFAPSPTGELHIGGLRTALYNYLYAKKYSGQFVLRIDDTDRTRFVEGAEQRLNELLIQFGLQPDESPMSGGMYAPYRQSERRHLYDLAINKIIENGVAYRCFCTPDRLTAVQAVRKAQKLPPRYDRTCRSLSKEDSLQRAKSEPFTVRISIPDKDILMKDKLRGDILFKAGATDDTILIKSDGFPTYHLATVVDDFEMKITDVIRGEEWLPSLPIHKTIADGLGIQLPNFIHIGLLVDDEGKKLSKRTGGAEVINWLNKGIPRLAIINAVARFGWEAGSTESLSLVQIVDKFEIEKLSTHSAMVSEQHFLHYSREWIKNASLNEIAQESSDANSIINHPLIKTISEFAIEESSTIHQWLDEVKFWILLKENTQTKFETDFPIEFKSAIQTLESTDITLEDWLKSLPKLTGLKGKSLWLPLRKKMTGREHGPELLRIIQFLGRNRLIQLLN